MFRRRQSQSVLARLRSILWPERGFRRLFAYLLQRIARMPGSTMSISIGLACGVSVSMTPFLGFHFALVAFMAYLLRGNILASAIGTVVGNPWTFPFILALDFEIGGLMLGQVGSQPPSLNISLNEIIANPEILVSFMMPMILGGLVLGGFAWFASFGMCYWALTGWREHRARRVAEGRMRRAKKGRMSGVGEDGEAGRSNPMSVEPDISARDEDDNKPSLQ